MADLPHFRIGRRPDLSDIPELAAVLTEQTASCTLPTGEAVRVLHRVPLYTLARELDARGYGDYMLQSYTPSGTPSLRGLVSVMAGLTVSETARDGLRLERFQEFPREGISYPAGGLVQRDEGSGAVMWHLFQRRSPVSPPGRLWAKR